MSTDNLESFYLIWLDQAVNETEENRQAQIQLRQSINFLRTFEEMEVCENYIQSISPYDRIVLIVSNHFGHQLVPRIHCLRQLFSVYVYCKDKNFAENWTKDLRKVRILCRSMTILLHRFLFRFQIKGISILLDETISQIRDDNNRRRRRDVDDPIVVTMSGEASTSNLDGEFIQNQVLIDCLLRMKSNKDAKRQLLDRCRQFYASNSHELGIIERFEQNYRPDRAIWWYTQETFVYRLMNKALRVRNLELLLLFSFVIRDIIRQLQGRKPASTIECYRCQMMSKEEIDVLKKLCGKSISMNSFVSTSLQRENCQKFWDDSSDLEQVLFKIEANPNLPGVKSFAYIASLSYFKEEDEVLFPMGSIFQIKSIVQNEGKTWVIELKLQTFVTNPVFQTFERMKQNPLSQETTIVDFADLVRRLGYRVLAEKYYQSYLNESETDIRVKADCYTGLGILKAEKHEYDKSLQWHQDSLMLKLEVLSANHPKIADSYNYLGIVHRKLGSLQTALNHHNKALKILQTHFGEQHPQIALCLSYTGKVHEISGDYDCALELYKQAAKMIFMSTPIDYRVLSEINQRLGHFYLVRRNYTDALKYLNESLKDTLKVFHTQHRSIAKNYQYLGKVHTELGKIDEARKYITQADDIHEHNQAFQKPS